MYTCTEQYYLSTVNYVSVLVAMAELDSDLKEDPSLTLL